MKKPFAAALAALCLLAAGDARPCGGPSFDLIDQALKPVDEFIAWASLEECPPEETDSSCAYTFGLSTITELRFLYPFHLARAADYDELFKRSYFEYETSDGTMTLAAPLSADDLGRKVGAGDWSGAEAEARGLVDRILNMPLSQANENAAVLARAVAVLDLKPVAALAPDKAAAYWRSTFGATYRPAFLNAPPAVSPVKEARAGTEAFIALKDAMRSKIPDGWLEDIRKNVTPEVWGALEKLHEAWLKDFPNHPLADLTKLSRVRLSYLEDKPTEAWRGLFDLYARRPVRAVGEMRFLLQQEQAPDPALVPDDKVLLAALTPWLKFRDGEAWSPLWTRLWNLSVREAKTPWGTNFQMRLIKKVADQAKPDGSLPEGLPHESLSSDPRWGAFRLFALYKAGRWDQAMAQARALKPTASTAAVVAKLHLRKKEWAEALSVKGLPYDAKRYLVRVLFDEDALRALKDFPDPKLRNEIRLTLGVRAAARGDWETGKSLLAEDAKRAGLWAQAARLASDSTPSGRLNLGRFLRKNDGKLFYPPDTVWYRSVFWRLSAVGRREDGTASDLPPAVDPGLPWNGEAEGAAIKFHLKALEPYLALASYADYLKATKGKTAERAAALKEADRTYNWLVNWANNYSEEWQGLLDKSEEAKIIRQAGKEM